MPPSEMYAQIATLDRLMPPGAAIFYVMPELEAWKSRMWKRALYPRPVFYVFNARELHGAEYDRVRQKYRIRFALSAGRPPLDPGYAWRTELPKLPGETDETWFGELR
jgi:hypothetical protein